MNQFIGESRAKQNKRGEIVFKILKGFSASLSLLLISKEHVYKRISVECAEEYLLK